MQYHFFLLLQTIVAQANISPLILSTFLNMMSFLSLKNVTN